MIPTAVAAAAGVARRDGGVIRRCVALILSFGCGACGGPYSALDPVGPEARSITTLGWSIITLMIVVTAAMGALIIFAAMRQRGSLGEHLPTDMDGGKRWILLGGVLMPVVVLTILFAVTLATLRAIPGTALEADLEVAVIGHQWWWEIRYFGDDAERRFTTANELHIPVGRRVLVQLQSADVIHSFWVPRLHGKLDLIPGHTNRLILEADEAGEYRGECAEYCGVQHAHMRFLVVAQPAAEFDVWTERQRRPAVAPAEPHRQRGLAAFEESACSQCHTVRGTRARGDLGPDLTHIGSRRTLGAGTLPNTRARLQAWIIDAQSLKPGVLMPSLRVFDGGTLDALAAYLESLQ